MTSVIEQARALGEALLASPEYKQMQLCEAEAAEDPGALAVQAAIESELAALRDAAASGAEQETVDSIRARVEGLKASLAAFPAIVARDEARQGFSRLMEQVNNVLQFTLTGEINPSGCSGNCSGCQGCA